MKKHFQYYTVFHLDRLIKYCLVCTGDSKDLHDLITRHPLVNEIRKFPMNVTVADVCANDVEFGLFNAFL